MQDLRSGQARSWALNLERERPKCPGFLGKGGKDLMGLVSSGGRGATKASSLPVVFCLGLLFLPASGLDVDSVLFLVVVMVVVALWYVCA